MGIFCGKLRVPIFLRNVGLLSIGTLSGQLAIIAFSPVITRLYSPSELGVYGLYSTLLMVALVLTSLRYEFAIPLCASKQECFELGSVCLVFTTAIAALIAGSSFLGVEPLLAPQLRSGWLLWLAIGAFLAGAFQVLTTVGIKLEQFKSQSVSRAVQGLTLSLSQIVFGLGGWRHSGLIMGDIIGRLMALLSATSMLVMPWSAALKELRLTKLPMLLRRYWEFPAFVLPGAVLNMLATQMLMVVGPRMFSLAETGAYFLAYRSLFLPGSFLASTVSQVFFGRIANQGIRSQQAASTYGVMLGLLGIGTPLYLGMFMHGMVLFPLVFGSEWELAGVYAFVMAPQMLVWLPATATSSVLLVNRKYRQSLLINVGHLLLTALGISWAVWRGDFLEGVITTSALALLLYSLGIIWFCKIAGVDWRLLLRSYINIVLTINLFFFGILALITSISPLVGLGVWIALIGPIWLLTAKTINSHLKRRTADTGFNSP